MVVSNRNLLFQGSIFRGALLVSGRVFGSPQGVVWILLLVSSYLSSPSGECARSIFHPRKQYNCWTLGINSPSLRILTPQKWRLGPEPMFNPFHWRGPKILGDGLFFSKSTKKRRDSWLRTTLYKSSKYLFLELASGAFVFFGGGCKYILGHYHKETMRRILDVSA